MIGSLRGLIVAAAIAGALVLAVIVDVARTPGTPDRAVWPGFAPDRVTELVWQRAGAPVVRAVRTGGWQLVAPARAPADPDAIGEVLAALRGARWHRRGPARDVRVATTLTIVAGGERRVLGLASGDATQRWIVDGDHAVLVDGWVVRALDRDALALRVVRPLAEAAHAATIVIEGEPPSAGVPEARVDLRLEGTPRRLVRPVALALAADVAGTLDRAQRDVEIVRAPDGPVTGHGLAITVAGEAGVTTVELAGDCAGAAERVAVTGTAGDGCIERAAADAVVRAVARLLEPPAAIALRQPLPFAPATLVLADGAALDVAALRVADRPADPTRVAELLAVLAAPAELVARPAGPVTQRVTARAGAAAITLELLAGRRVARAGEPIALQLAPGAWDVLVRPARALRDPALWLEEPTTITAVRVDDVRYTRGAVIGAWSRQPAGIADAAALEALVGLLAAPRARDFVDRTAPPFGGAAVRAPPAGDPPLAVAHRVALTVTPPAGPTLERVLELGAPRATGCPARVGADIVVLPIELCAQVARLAH